MYGVQVHIRTESVLNWVPDGVRCIPNNQPIECKFVVVNYPSSAILEDSKRIDFFLLVTRHFVAFQMHAPQSLDHGKSQSLCQRLFSPSLINAIIIVVRPAIESQCVSGLPCHSYFS